MRTAPAGDGCGLRFPLLRIILAGMGVVGAVVGGGTRFFDF